MHKNMVLLVLLFVFAGPAHVMAEDASAANPLCCNGFHKGMLDTSVPRAKRLQLFAHVIELAKKGQVRAQDLAGTMYWQGKRIHGSPVGQNLQQAYRLLSNAAVHGDVTAMAKVAELQLSKGNALAAMVWAQLYAHYLAPNKSPRARHGRRFAYASDLIQRIKQAGGDISDKVAGDVNATVAKYDDQIRAGLDGFREWQRSGNPRLIQTPTRENLRGEAAQLSGIAQFIVAFDPSGKPVQVWTLASWPTGKEAGLVRSWVDTARANSAGENAGLRYQVVQIDLHAVHARKLRPHHG